jgi:hypothetical protein
MRLVDFDSYAPIYILLCPTVNLVLGLQLIKHSDAGFALEIIVLYEVFPFSNVIFTTFSFTYEISSLIDSSI